MTKPLSIEIKRSKKKQVRFILFSIPLAALAIWIATKASSGSIDMFIGWIGAVFFGLSTILRVFLFFDNKAQITLDDKGILDRRLKIGRLKWEDIENAEVYSRTRQKFIALSLNETSEKPLNPINNKLNNMLGAGNINLNMSLLDFDPELLADVINGLRILNVDERKGLLAKMN